MWWKTQQWKWSSRVPGCSSEDKSKCSSHRCRNGTKAACTWAPLGCPCLPTRCSISGWGCDSALPLQEVPFFCALISTLREVKNIAGLELKPVIIILWFQIAFTTLTGSYYKDRSVCPIGHCVIQGISHSKQIHDDLFFSQMFSCFFWKIKSIYHSLV